MLNSSKNFLPSYQPLLMKGKGSFGNVLEAIDKTTNKKVAIKRVHKVENLVSREIQILNELKDCANVINLLRVFYSVDLNDSLVQNLVFDYYNSK